MPDRPPTPTLNERLERVRLVVLDVDGVLTDGRIIVDDHGVESKHFHVRDGWAIAHWHRRGGRTAILSGRAAACVDRRGAELGINPVVQGSGDKGEALRRIAAEVGVGLDEVAFMGDDLPDLPALALAGLATCPLDAAPEVRGIVDWEAGAPGGLGAVRALIELVMKAQGTWPEAPAGRASPA